MTFIYSLSINWYIVGGLLEGILKTPAGFLKELL